MYFDWIGKFKMLMVAFRPSEQPDRWLLRFTRPAIEGCHTYPSAYTPSVPKYECQLIKWLLSWLSATALTRAASFSDSLHARKKPQEHLGLRLYPRLCLRLCLVAQGNQVTWCVPCPERHTHMSAFVFHITIFEFRSTALNNTHTHTLPEQKPCTTFSDFERHTVPKALQSLSLLSFIPAKVLLALAH